MKERVFHSVLKCSICKSWKKRAQFSSILITLKSLAVVVHISMPNNLFVILLNTGACNSMIWNDTRVLLHLLFPLEMYNLLNAQEPWLLNGNSYINSSLLIFIKQFQLFLVLGLITIMNYLSTKSGAFMWNCVSEKCKNQNRNPPLLFNHETSSHRKHFLATKRYFDFS